jgi:hypothetical protein
MALKYLKYLGDRVGSRADAEDEIWSIDGTDHADWILESELLDDVVTNPRRGGGGTGQHRDTGKLFAEAGESAVVRAEVMAPLADAVGLVDRDQTRLGGGENRKQ